jgi:hypothetical protein
MKILCVACGVVYANVAVAQQVINPIVLAPAARAALPQGEVTIVSQRTIRYAKQKRSKLPPRGFTEDEGSPFDWPWAAQL